MRPTTWLNNTRASRYRAPRESRDVNSSDGTGPPQPPQQFGMNDGYYSANAYSAFYPPHQMFHPAFHRSYSAPDHSSLVGNPHAHGNYYAHHEFHSRPVTPHAPSPLGLSGQYGLRPDAVPFDPSSPLVAPSPLLAYPAPQPYRASCYDSCGDDCPFADPYLTGWLERNAKEKELETTQASPHVPLKSLRNGGKVATVLQPGWLERMVKDRESRGDTMDTPRTTSPPPTTGDHTVWEYQQSMNLRGGQLSDFQDSIDFADKKNLRFSRFSTPALPGQRTSTSRFFPPGLPRQHISTSRSSTPSTCGQHMSTFQSPVIATGSQHALLDQGSATASTRSLDRLLQPFNGNSYDHLDRVRQAFKRAENAKRTLELSDSPCSSSNNSQQSSWSIEDVADDIQPGDSCSLFISGLPNDVTLSELLGSIRGYGRVRYSKITSSAALVVFFERNAAQKLAREGQLAVGEVQVKVCLAKKRIAQSTLSLEASRVLVITGFIGGLNVAFLKECLQMKNIQYELDKIVRGASGGMFALEWHFASHTQAAKAMELIMTEPYFSKKGVNATYGIDPCAGPCAGPSRDM
ncbi:hypothetical protein QBC36DRAFT_199775 [Triangularia setosa]|uniref:RRM domain-containing protein n=1 Tax=Triangularia setosa TaxID=2587417 RepID=A0AAN6VXJ9_9PEZI|nr:hypothetical protein QBC36DRAFT_199775 [Podospora setosa]